MRLLIDTNIFLEILLAQAKADEAKDLLSRIDAHDFFIYVVAEKYGLMIVSLDHDFDRTVRGRTEPADVV